MAREKFLYKYDFGQTTKRKLDKYELEHHSVVYENGQPKWVQHVGDLVDQVNAEIAGLARSGYRTSNLRQLYYKLIGRNYMPNHLTVYKEMGKAVNRAKYKGKTDWQAIEDLGRTHTHAFYEDSVQQALEDCHSRYKLDRQTGQPVQLLVMAEKFAVYNIVRPICDRYTVRYCINKGYSSGTLIYEVYESVVESVRRNRPVRILYLGDHDPSGLNMLEDIHGRLCHMLCTGQEINLRHLANKLAEWEEHDEGDKRVYPALNEVMEAELLYKGELEGKQRWWVRDFREPENGKIGEKSVYFDSVVAGAVACYIFHRLVTIEHVALTMEQVQELELPPNPAKTTDSRSKKYIEEHGHDSWELEALPHDVLAELLTAAIEKHMNMEQYERVLEREEEQRNQLREIIDNLE